MTRKLTCIAGLVALALSGINCGQEISRSLEAENKEPPVAESEAEVKKTRTVVMETSLGTIKLELWADKAPVTVKNFIRYAEEKFYDGTIFHRVIPNFMIQGGGFTSDMGKKKCHDPIINEARSDVKNLRGTIAMARTTDVNSATAQFFINVADNDMLDHKDKTVRGFGYCAFGKVIEGMDVADKIVSAPTVTKGGHENVPVDEVTIKSVTVID